ncbi:MAG: tetratricopeptide repeat protein [Candidatus Solibacter usitatus]|nr:tetratricopeptide repeat protein [Candidatus Solibacter usitatus]
MSSLISNLYEFGPFRLDTAKRLLFHQDQMVPLNRTAMETLVVLVESHGELVEKAELMGRVWPGTAVEENNLNQSISTLRKALGESSTGPPYIATVSGRGYRFAADIRRVAVEEPLPPRPPRRSVVTKAAILFAIAAPATWGIYKWASRRAGVAAQPPLRSLAVLPFQSLTAAAGEEYLGLGISDALITRLSNVRNVIIRPTSSVVRYAEGSQDAIAAGRALKVDTVLEGKLQRSGDRIRLTVQLLRVADGVPLWAGRFDQQFTGIFDLHDSISERVTNALILQLTSEEKNRIAKRHTANPEAYRAYMKGRYHWTRNTPDDLEKAVEHFQQAIRLDPEYALAYAGIADCYVFGRGQSGSRRASPLRDRYPIAKAAAAKALALDGTLAEAYAPRAYLKLAYDWDWAGAEKDFLRAIELNPGYAAAHQWYAECLMYLGRSKEALAAVERARELDPFSPAVNDSLVRVLYYGRQYDRALRECLNTIELHPNFDQAHILLGRVYEEKGMLPQAIAAFQKAVTLSDGLPGALASLGHAYAVSGRRADARNVLRDLQELSKQRYVSGFLIAMVFAGLDEKDNAVELLEKAYEQRDAGLRAIKVDPKLDKLRTAPKFQALLRRIGFDPNP